MDQVMKEAQSARSGPVRGRGGSRGRSRGRADRDRDRVRGGINKKRADHTGDVVMKESSLEARLNRNNRGRDGDRGRRRGALRNRGGSRPAPKDSESQKELKATHSKETQEVKEKFRQILAKRYDGTLRLLNLSALAQDPDLVELGLLNLSTASASKFFPALMIVCDQMFASPDEKKAAIVSVSLAKNGINSVRFVSALAQTFPDLINLDLSDNNLKEMKDIFPWRWRFRDMRELVLTNNPIVQDSELSSKLADWYPNLQLYNGVQIVRPVSSSKPQSTQPQTVQIQAPNVPAIQAAPPPFQAPQVQQPEPQALPLQQNEPSNEQKEALTKMLMDTTHMTFQYTVMCLEGNAWDIERAYANYQQLKPSLPADAFDHSATPDGQIPA